MNTSNLEALGDDELVERFQQLSLRQGQAVMANDSRTYNRCFDQLRDIGDELKQRGPEARQALLPLLDCPHAAGSLSAVAQCRYNAARELLAMEPDRARATLEDLAKQKTYNRYQMALARGTLEALGNGTFNPT